MLTSTILAAVVGSCWGAPVYCPPRQPRPVYYVQHHVKKIRHEHDVRHRHHHAHEIDVDVHSDPVQVDVDANVNVAPIDVRADVRVSSEPLEIIVKHAPVVNPPAPGQHYSPAVFYHPWYVWLPWMLIFLVLGCLLFAFLCRLLCGKFSYTGASRACACAGTGACEPECSCLCGHKPKKKLKVVCICRPC